MMAYFVERDSDNVITNIAIGDDDWSCEGYVKVAPNIRPHIGEKYDGTNIVDDDGNVVDVSARNNVVLYEARTKRKELLEKEVDPIISNPLRWDSLSAEVQQEWLDYRTALLNVTIQITDSMTDLDQVTFPTRPSTPADDVIN